MAIDSSMEVHEAAVSSETAISCLTLLSTQFGAQVDTENVCSQQRLRNATLAISELIELANDFGFKAQYAHRDWPWLQLAVATQPILLLLKNGNTIVAVGAGRTSAEEIVVSDPLHRDGALIILPRGNIERAWDGDIVTITPKSLVSENLYVNRDVEVTEKIFSKTGKTKRIMKRLGVAILCFGSVALVSALIIRPIAEQPAVSQKPGPAVPAIAPLHVSATANGAGRQHASDQAANGSTPIAPLAYIASGSIAADAISRPLGVSLPANPSNPESTVVALLASTPAPIAQVTAQPNVADPAASPQALLGTLIPGQIATSTAMPLLSGSRPTREGSGLSGDVKPPASDVAALLARGDDQLRLGDVTSARLFYEHAADAGEANAALRLGETFDPIFLSRANLHGVSGDMAKAMFWYLRAHDLGSNEAEKLLRDLAENNGVIH